MAAFKLPSRSLKKRRRQLSLSEFRWNSISLKEELGRGTFGTVYLARNAPVRSNVLLLRNLNGKLQMPNDVLKRKPLYCMP